MLIAIDGTGSSTWRRDQHGHSHVFDFHEDYVAHANAKYFHDGPDSTLGFDVRLIADDVEDWARRRYAQGDRTVDIVGHSRGGMIAIVLCKRMSRWPGGSAAVRFLGLYDAVHMAPSLESTAVIPDNVACCAHAKRYLSNLNRFYFVNTGRSGGKGKYFEKRFYASHAAIGGASAGGLIKADGQDGTEGPKADRWIREKAVACGIQFAAARTGALDLVGAGRTIA
jgi:pimeloyl-ACP methyl ester carboxylesterase